MRKYVIKSRKATIHSHKNTVIQLETKQSKQRVISSYASTMAAFDHKTVCSPRPVPKMRSNEDTELNTMNAFHSSSDRTLVTTNTTASVRNFAPITPKSTGGVRTQLHSPFEVTPSKRLFYFNRLKASKNDPKREEIIANSKICASTSKVEREGSFNNFQKKSSNEDRQNILRKLRNEKRRMELERTKKSVIKERSSLLNHVKAYSNSKSQFHEFIEPRTFYKVSKQDEEAGNPEELKKRNTARRKELLSRARSYKRLDDQQKKSTNAVEDLDSGLERRENFLLDNFRAAQSFFTLEKANTQRTEIELNIEDEPMKMDVIETESEKNAFIDNFRAAHSFFTNEIMKAETEKHQDNSHVDGANTQRTEIELNIEDEPLKMDVIETETKKNAFIDNFRAAHSFFTNEIMKADTEKHQDNSHVDGGRLKSALQKESSMKRTDPIQEILKTIIPEPDSDEIPKQIFIKSHVEIDTVGSELLQKEDGHATQESVFKSGFEEVATMQVSDTVVNQGLVYDKEEKKNVQSKSQEREYLVYPSVPSSIYNEVATTTQEDEFQVPFSKRLSPVSSDRKIITTKSDSEKEPKHVETLDESEYRKRDDTMKEMTRCNSLEQERDKREIKYQTQSLLSNSSESSESSSLDEKETSLRVLFHNSMKKLSVLLGETKSEDSSFESFASDDDSSTSE